MAIPSVRHVLVLYCGNFHIPTLHVFFTFNKFKAIECVAYIEIVINALLCLSYFRLFLSRLYIAFIAHRLYIYSEDLIEFVVTVSGKIVQNLIVLKFWHFWDRSMLLVRNINQIKILATFQSHLASCYVHINAVMLILVLVLIGLVLVLVLMI